MMTLSQWSESLDPLTKHGHLDFWPIKCITDLLNALTMLLLALLDNYYNFPVGSYVG